MTIFGTRLEPLDRAYLAAALFCAAVFLAGFVVGLPSDIEDYYSTALSTALFMKALARGDSPFWTDLLGFGLPQPFRISLIQHPLGFLFAVLTPLGAARCLVFVHGMAAVLFSYLLCRRLEMPGPVAAACACSFILSTSSVQYLLVDDWFSMFLTWCLVPGVLYLFVSCGTEGPGRPPAFGVALGLAIGLLVATGLASHTLAIVIVLAVFFCLPPTVLRARWQSFVVSGILALLIAGGLALLLAGELMRFPQTAEREQHVNAEISQHVTSLFMWPSLKAIWASPARFSNVVLSDSHRTVGFGPVAGLLVLPSLLLPARVVSRRIKVAFVASVLFTVAPPALFAGTIRATWVFRDGVNAFGIVLFGLGVSWLGRTRPRSGRWVGAICALQVGLMVLAAAPLWVDALRNTITSRSLANIERQDALLQRFASVAERPTEGRVLMSPSLAWEVRRGTLLDDGLAVNTAALHGIRVVNTFARGIATSRLHPDAALMEGTVDSTESNIKDRSFLDVLAIRHVLSWEGEMVADGLRKEGSLAAGRDINLGRRVTVWLNPTAWPLVVELDPRARDERLSLKPDCGHDRFLCSDFGPVRRLRTGDPATAIVQRAGEIRFTLPVEPRERILLVSTWYRPGWTAGDSRVEVFPLFGELIGLRVPPGIGEVSLSFRPLGLMASYAVSTLAAVGAVLYLLGVWRVSRRRGPRPTGFTRFSPAINSARVRNPEPR